LGANERQQLPLSIDRVPVNRLHRAGWFAEGGKILGGAWAGGGPAGTVDVRRGESSKTEGKAMSRWWFATLTVLALSGAGGRLRGCPTVAGRQGRLCQPKRPSSESKVGMTFEEGEGGQSV